MSRKIKFRAWDDWHHQWFYLTPDKDAWYGVSDLGKSNHHMTFRERPTKDAVADHRFKNVELMQFTGLTDMNDEEIYEGDVVHFKDPHLNDELCGGQIAWNDDGHWDIVHTFYKDEPDRCTDHLPEYRGIWTFEWIEVVK